MFLARRLTIQIYLIFIGITFIWVGTSNGITIAEEEQLGRETIRILKQKNEFVNDYIILSYLNTISHRLLKTLPPQPFKYRFYLVKSDVLNAMAFPGGHILLTTGIVEIMENENELAAILGHEIGHVSARHIAKKIKRSSKISMASLAGVITGLILGVSGAGTAAGAVTLSSVAAGKSVDLAFSRQDENEADQFGLTYLTSAGFNPNGVYTMLTKIRNKNWVGSETIPNYLSTHPALEDRITHIKTLTDISDNHIHLKKHSVDIDFTRMHNRLLALFSNEYSAEGYFQNQLQTDGLQSLAYYGLGILNTRTGNRREAIKQFQKALNISAFDPYILIELGHLYFLGSNYPKALRILKSASSIAGFNPECYFYLGRAQMEAGHLDDARRTLETLITKNSNYPQAYYYLGEIYEKKGLLYDAHYNLGLYYKKKGKIKNALFHFSKASKHINEQEKIKKLKQLIKSLEKRIQKKTDSQSGYYTF